MVTTIQEISPPFGYDRIYVVEGNTENEVNQYLKNRVENIVPAYFPQVRFAAYLIENEQGELVWRGEYSKAKKV